MIDGPFWLPNSVRQRVTWIPFGICFTTSLHQPVIFLSKVFYSIFSVWHSRSSFFLSRITLFQQFFFFVSLCHLLGSYAVSWLYRCSGCTMIVPLFRLNAETVASVASWLQTCFVCSKMTDHLWLTSLVAIGLNEATSGIWLIIFRKLSLLTACT